MVKKNKSLLEENTLGTVILRCDDLCSMLVVDKFQWGLKGEAGRDINYNISMQDSSYHSGVNGIKERLRRAWKCLCGKPIYYNDIYIEDENRVVQFKNELEKLIEK